MPAASHSMHRYVERHTMSVTLRRTQHSWPRSVHRRQEMVLVGGVILWEDTIGGDYWMMMMV
jgi:hypothetical protein